MTGVPSRAARLLRFMLPLRKEERRLARLRRAIFFAVIGVLLAVGVLTLLYYQTDWFGVRQIEVRGCSRLDPAYIRTLSGEPLARPRPGGSRAGHRQRALGERGGRLAGVSA